MCAANLLLLEQIQPDSGGTYMSSEERPAPQGAALCCWRRLERLTGLGEGPPVLVVLVGGGGLGESHPKGLLLLPKCPSALQLSSLSYEERYRNADSSAGILDAALSFVATSVGLDLPRTLTIVDGLLVATAFLLRLTENVPAEVLLFLMVSGAVFWLFIVLLLGCGTVGGIGFLLLYFTQGTQYMPDQRSVMNTYENTNTVPLLPPELPELSAAA